MGSSRSTFLATHLLMGGMAITSGNKAVTVLELESWIKGVRIFSGSNKLEANFGETVGDLATF